MRNWPPLWNIILGATRILNLQLCYIRKLLRWWKNQCSKYGQIIFISWSLAYFVTVNIGEGALFQRAFWSAAATILAWAAVTLYRFRVYRGCEEAGMRKYCKLYSVTCWNNHQQWYGDKNNGLQDLLGTNGCPNIGPSFSFLIVERDWISFIFLFPFYSQTP